MTSRTASQLAVDPAGLVTFSADDLQAGGTGGEVQVGAQLNVGAAAGHVGGDRDRTLLARAGHNLSFALVILGVQHFVLEAAPFELAGERLGYLDRHGTDQDRQPQAVQSFDLVDDRIVLLAPRLVDVVLLVVPPHRLVGRDDGDLEPVDREELGLFRLGRAGHAGQLVVHPEVVLNRDGGERLGLALHLHVLLRFDRLVQPVRPAAACHDAPGELVYDEHLTILDQVVHFFLVQRMRLQQLMDDVELLAL